MKGAKPGFESRPNKSERALGCLGHVSRTSPGHDSRLAGNG